MGRFAQLVIGPAGSGKSTYCDNLRQHCEAIGRTVHVVNLGWCALIRNPLAPFTGADPAAEEFKYPVSFDVRDLVSLEDVMEEMQLGPNGGLLYAMEYMEDNLDDWLADELEAYGEDDYLIFDCPGQIELYSHVSVFRTLVDWMRGQGWSMCAVYCLDCQFITETPKFIAGSLQALSAMVQLELPHVNVLTKVDLLSDKTVLDAFLYPDTRQMAAELSAQTGPGFRKMNDAVAKLVDEYSMVNFQALDISDEESIAEVLYNIDTAIQFGEDADVKIRDMPGEMGLDDE